MDQEGLDFLTEQKIELVLAMKTKRYEEEIARLQTMVSNIQADMMEMRKDISRMNAPPPSRGEIRITPKEEGYSRPEPKPEPRPEPRQYQPPQEVKKEPHPRQGNVKPEDVSIEKYFNFSGK